MGTLLISPTDNVLQNYSLIKNDIVIILQSYSDIFQFYLHSICVCIFVGYSSGHVLAHLFIATVNTKQFRHHKVPHVVL